MELDGKVAIVTGPAKGMGPAICRALAREGAHLVFAARDTGAVFGLAQEIEGLGRRTLTIECDVTDAAQVEALAEAAMQLTGRIDILVNVAGGTGPLETTAWDTSPAQFDQIVELNMKGCFLTMRAVSAAMMAQRWGKIVNIGGTFGLRGRALRMAYSASKWGLRGITKSFALELGPFNVNVNCVCPGMVDGPRFESVCSARAKRLNITKKEARKFYESEYALRRISTDEDVANAVLFFASDRSRQITGQDLAVDGGWVI
jgi:3-oxoacyl-[acyl-carrier protein] reductase